MLKDYYQEQLDMLKELAGEFSKKHPAIAPMLSGQSKDPDVERLIEGMAFLTGMLNARLDDSFPEIVHTLMQLLSPQYIRPLPSSTIIKFSPKPGFREALTIPKGTEIKSIPVGETECIFRTCFDVEVFPVEIERVFYEDIPGKPCKIGVSLLCTECDFKKIPYLRLFLSGSFVHSTNLFYLLFARTKEIILSFQDKKIVLSKGNIKAPFFSLEFPLFPYPRNSFFAYRLFQEYFILPEKFLFLDIYGLDKLAPYESIENIKMEFILDKDIRAKNLTLSNKSISLFCTPAINIFSHDAVPIELVHNSFEYKVMPGGQYKNMIQIFSIDRVRGIVQGRTDEKEYYSLESKGLDKGDGIYYQNIRPSPLSGEPDHYLTIGYRDKKDVTNEILLVELTCTNGDTVNSLQTGDIHRATDSSPVLCTFENIIPPTPNYSPVLSKESLWRFLSHYSINVFSLSSAEKLQDLLKLYIEFQRKDTSRYHINLNRIQGILDLKIESGKRLYKGGMLFGHDINLLLSSDHFIGEGDMYIFVRLLDYFFAYYASINSYTCLKVKDKKTGRRILCPPRLGEQLLI